MPTKRSTDERPLSGMDILLAAAESLRMAEINEFHARAGKIQKLHVKRKRGVFRCEKCPSVFGLRHNLLRHEVSTTRTLCYIINLIIYSLKNLLTIVFNLIVIIIFYSVLFIKDVVLLNVINLNVQLLLFKDLI